MAAEQGHAKAQDKLGCMYANGEGVSQDYDKAARWLWKAMQGDDESPQDKKILIALTYVASSRVWGNEVEAYAWVLLAKASVGVSILEKRLTAEQIKKGKERAAELSLLIKDKGKP